MRICQDGSNELFVYYCYVFLGVSVIGVCVSACKMFSLRLALAFIVSVCSLNVSIGSSFTPRSVALHDWMQHDATLKHLNATTCLLTKN